MKRDRRGEMKHTLFLLIMVISVVSLLSACGEHQKQDKQQFDQQLKKVEQKEQAFYKAYNDADFHELKTMRHTEATEDNKAAFEQKQRVMNESVRPKWKAYRKEAQKLPTPNKDVEALKKEYLKAVDKKGQSLNQTSEFISLCLDTIKSNENIIEYTQKFEKRRKSVEDELTEAKVTPQGQQDSEILETVLAKNNSNIKKEVEDVLSEKNEIKRSQRLKNEIFPLIQTHIKSLNQERIHDNTVNNARQHAIQMYYELENYYKERAKNAINSEKLSEMNIKHVIRTSDELEHYETTYHQKNDEIESQLQ